MYSAWKIIAMTYHHVKRSAVYHLLNTIAPSNHKLKAELDVLGVVAIVAFALGTVVFAAYMVH
jgi:hypothetical protein